MNNERDTPQYKEWRLKVLKRDKFKCRKCGKKTKLYCHHIKTWASYPALRYDPSNGIALCGNCHKQMWGSELSWESLCYGLLAGSKLRFQLGRILYGEEEAE
jgi:transcription elongation factor Elf1